MAKLIDASPTQGTSLLTAAKKYQGKPYFNGGGAKSSPTAGFDCSGLVWYAINQAGFKYTYAATGSIPHSTTLRKLSIPPDAPQDGDLVLFAGHVGFYDSSAGAKSLYSATTSHGVRNEDPKYFGAIMGYYRLQVAP